MADSLYVVTYAAPDDSNFYGVALFHNRFEAETALEAMEVEYYESAELLDEDDADDSLPAPYGIEEVDPGVLEDGEVDKLEKGIHVLLD
jgi:hypothetical protein